MNASPSWGALLLADRWARVVRSAGATELVEDDELAWQLRAIKSPVEQTMMRAAGKLDSTAMSAALAAAVPAATEADVAAAFVEVLIRAGGALFDVAVSSGPYANTLAASHAPAAYTLRELEAGDLLRIDAYGSLAGYLQPGMCLAVERRIAEAEGHGAQHEDNVLITPTGPELLTRT